jgi:hypothetical protein
VKARKATKFNIQQTDGRIDGQVDRQKEEPDGRRERTNGQTNKMDGRTEFVKTINDKHFTKMLKTRKATSVSTFIRQTDRRDRRADRQADKQNGRMKRRTESNLK